MSPDLQSSMRDVVDTDLLLSFFADASELHTTEELRACIEAEKRTSDLHVSRVPFDSLADWHFDANGNLVHDSGKFFSIQGACIRQDGAESVQRLMAVQPEVGVLGILAQRRGGLFTFLLQLKGEPGNIGKIQVSPTVQATKSNYTAVHKGRAVPYLDLFLHRDATDHPVDAELSEQATCFFRKNNRNMIRVLDTDAKVSPLPEFRWFTLGQLLRLSTEDNVINMNTRSIISGIRLGSLFGEMSVSAAERLYEAVNLQPTIKGKDTFVSLMNCRAQHSLEDLVVWLEGKKSVARLSTTLIPLNRVVALRRDPMTLAVDGGGFRVLALNVTASSREVRSWSQPIIELRRPGIHGFLGRKIDGVLHVLVRAIEEPGSGRGVEIGPTVQSLPLEPDTAVGDPPFAEYFRNPPREHVYLSVMQSDEGGRFYQVQNRNMLVLTDEDPAIGDDYRWATLFQLRELIRRPQFVNMEARSVASCINCREL